VIRTQIQITGERAARLRNMSSERCQRIAGRIRMKMDTFSAEGIRRQRGVHCAWPLWGATRCKAACGPPYLIRIYMMRGQYGAEVWQASQLAASLEIRACCMSSSAGKAGEGREALLPAMAADVCFAVKISLQSIRTTSAHCELGRRRRAQKSQAPIQQRFPWDRFCQPDMPACCYFRITSPPTCSSTTSSDNRERSTSSARLASTRPNTSISAAIAPVHPVW